MRLYAAQPDDLQWLVLRTQAGLTAGARGIKAVDERGLTRGMVVYDGWTENAVTAHMAVDTPIAWRALIKGVFEYPFVECGRQVLLGLIPSHNKRSWRMATSLGMEIRHVVRDGWAKGDDLLVMELRREDCRFLKENHHG